MNLKVEAKVNLDEEQIQSRFTSNLFGLKLAAEWKKLIDPYTPRDTGKLMNDIKIEPFAIRYNAPYAHYQYTGIVYEDPKFHVAGWKYMDLGSKELWYSRKGVKKVMRTHSVGRRYQYLVHSLAKNPFAQAEWDIAADEAGKRQNLADVMSEYLRRRIL